MLGGPIGKDFEQKVVTSTVEVKQRVEEKKIGGVMGAPQPPGKPIGSPIKKIKFPPIPVPGKDGDVDIYDQKLMEKIIGQCDINGDGKVNIEDINLLTRFLLGMDDLDGDGKVTMKDISLRTKIGWFGGGDINKDGKINEKDLKALIDNIKNYDKDGDHDIDKNDVNKIRDTIKKFDLSGDGKVNAEDVEMLSRFLLGDPDVNGDGIVNFLDFFLKFSLATKADFNKDGKVDFADLEMLMQAIKDGDVAKEKKPLIGGPGPGPGPVIGPIPGPIGPGPRPGPVIGPVGGPVVPGGPVVSGPIGGIGVFLSSSGGVNSATMFLGLSL
ncbi:MAG: Dockerin type I repeat protein [bacterium ADurb.Bin363]|nr:MAG: Dockerin type I repeat protein [bacterium ADurb.Bin363]